jgi:hypothetical protein
MIRFFVPYRDCLVEQHRAKIVYGFLENMQDVLKAHSDCECVLMLYKNSDNIKDVVGDYGVLTEDVEPNDDQFLHISKCYNQAFFNSKKRLIAPMGIDFRVSDTRLIDHIKKVFGINDVLLRIRTVLMSRDDKIERIVFNPLVIERSLVMKMGGFDERFKEWGQEDDDLTFRMRHQIPDEFIELYLNTYNYIHVWHEKDFQRKSAAKYNHGPQGDIKLGLIKDNIKNNSANIINSYW